MTTLAYSHTLVAGTPENINDVQDMFNDMKTLVNGNLDATNFATTAKPATLMGAFRTVGQAAVSVTGSVAAATYYTTGTGAVFASGTGAAVPAVIPVILADHAVSGLTSQFRVEAAWLTNSVAPGVTFTLGLYPMTGASGSGATITVTLGTVVSGSTVALTTPPASTGSTAASSDFTITGGGAYLLGFVNSGTTAANSCTALGLSLRVHNV